MSEALQTTHLLTDAAGIGDARSRLKCKPGYEGVTIGNTIVRVGDFEGFPAVIVEVERDGPAFLVVNDGDKLGEFGTNDEDES